MKVLPNLEVKYKNKVKSLISFSKYIKDPHGVMEMVRKKLFNYDKNNLLSGIGSTIENDKIEEIRLCFKYGKIITIKNENNLSK